MCYCRSVPLLLDGFLAGVVYYRRASEKPRALPGKHCVLDNEEMDILEAKRAGLNLLNPSDDRFCVVYSLTGSLDEAVRAAFPGHEMKSRTEVAIVAAELLERYDIVARLQQLSAQFSYSLGISKAGHLHKLAEIRDRAIDNDQLEIALKAEKNRGEAAGYYATITDKSVSATHTTSSEKPVTPQALARLSDDEIETLATTFEKLQTHSTYEEKSRTVEMSPRRYLDDDE